MAKGWIACVDQSQGHITNVRYLEEGAAAWKTVSRDYVLQRMAAGVLVYSAYGPSGDNMTQGAQVHREVVNGVAYLQTDRNRTPRDNLGNLPGLGNCPV